MTPLAYVKVGVVLVGVVATLWAAKSLYDYGKATATTQIEQANDASEGKANAAERDVLACPPGKWSKEGRKCEP